MAGRRRQGGPSNRPTQVGEQIRQFLSQQLLEGTLHDPRLKVASMLTVTEVRMSPDLRLATALVSIYPEDEAVVVEVFEGLVSATNEMRRMIGRALKLRYTPELRFQLDDSIAYGAKIEALLKEIMPSDPPEPATESEDDGGVVSVSEGDASEAAARSDDDARGHLGVDDDKA